ncbi:adenine deaminase C-terminal domain-containing protein [[Clostridium] fimetarium]|uniref:Adenine deaminase n=1 Tax=[Clostridium] fimetarium TaxID=99656 RepID=A0A1I0N578_9FIRM|nr:adenine deaminase C-terminal domain-containing protein [[Clostridium] fimetarium]SEV96014.1 adenine deaminase [[Clostridium] fimetarium]
MKIDLIIKNAYVFQTYRQCFEKKDMAIAGDRIYDMAPVINEKDCKIIDATGKFIIPGLIDIHMHIESSMTYPIEFSKTVLQYGVTTVVADPHEIANVFGMEGIEVFMKQKTSLDIFYGIPSSVPSTSENIETAGAVIDIAEVEQLLQNDKIICLGEVMNFKDMISEESTRIKRIMECCKKNPRHILIEGHCPQLTHEECARYLFEGVSSDHTQQTAATILEKVDLGMFLELQKKSLSKEIFDTINQYCLYESVALVTDDTMPDELIKGQLNEILKEAVRLGMPIEKAIYCSTYTPARRMQLFDRGVIAPGKIADFVILNNLDTFLVEQVYKSGKKVTQDCLDNSCDYKNLFPKHFYESIHCRKANPSDFHIPVKEGCTSVIANVIKISKFGTFTKQKQVKLDVKEGEICWQEAGLSLITIFERYGKNGNIGHGFVENALKEKGAVATTWSHDSHNLLVIGNSVKDMIAVQHNILSMQGGYSVSKCGKIIAEAPLNIGGILSEQPLEVLAEQIKKVRDAIEGLGYCNNNVIMSISTLALVVSPEIKMTDRGLFHVKTQTFVPLIE